MEVVIFCVVILPTIILYKFMLPNSSKSLITRLSEWFLVITAVILVCITVVACIWFSDGGVSFRDLRGSSFENPLSVDR